MDRQTKAAIIVIAVIIPISALIVWNSDQTNVSASTTRSSKIVAVASFYPLYEFTKEVGKEKVEVSLAVPFGIEPHDWEPTINDLQKIQQADIIVINGIGFENWINDIDTANSNVIVIDTSNDISVKENEILEKNKEEIQKNTILHDNSYVDDNSLADPHIWLNPIMAKTQVKNIENALVKIDPTNEKYYRQNAKSYTEKLNLLDLKIRNELSPCKKDFIAFHNAFAYFSTEYGLNQHTILNSNDPNVEPTSKTLEEIIILAKKLEINVIFTEEAVNPRTSQVISNEIGGKVLVLSPIEVLENNTNYILKMEQNLSNLKEALCI